jgi:hypothetical protein
MVSDESEYPQIRLLKKDWLRRYYLLPLKAASIKGRFSPRKTYFQVIVFTPFLLIPSTLRFPPVWELPLIASIER